MLDRPRPTVYGPRAAQEGLRACKSLIALAWGVIISHNQNFNRFQLQHFPAPFLALAVCPLLRLRAPPAPRESTPSDNREEIMQSYKVT